MNVLVGLIFSCIYKQLDVLMIYVCTCVQAMPNSVH